MPIAKANGLELFYDMRGPAGAPAILLIMGLGTQMTAWSDPFCDGLAARGFRVIRFDNRDVGLSTKFDGVPTPNLKWAFLRAVLGISVNAPYSLDDMARDAVGLLDALQIQDAHVVGASMGGMIAQLVTAHHRNRVRSLVSIMSSSGDRRLPLAKAEAREAMLTPRPTSADREQAIRQVMGIYRVIGSPAYPIPEDELRVRVAAAVDRSYYPQGTGRQLLAILADGSRVARLGTIRAPTLVIHGQEDPLVPLEAGKHTAASIPGAKLMIIPGMGHDLPPPLTPVLVEAIASHCATADGAGAGAEQAQSA